MKKQPVNDHIKQDAPDKEAKKKLTKRAGKAPNREEKQQEVIAHFAKRFSDMESARKHYEAKRDICDGQMEANTFYDDNGTLQVNVPLEQDLVETACGRFSGKLNFKLEPIGNQSIVEDQQASKHILSHYIRSERMHKEVSTWRWDKAVYGTAIYYCGIVADTNTTFKIKEGAQIESADQLWNNKNYEELTEENYYFTGYNIPLRSFWIDDRAIKRKDINGKHHEAEDAIMKETMSLDRFKERYGDNKYFINIDQVDEHADANPPYGEQMLAINEEVQIYHYFNKVSKDYRVIANETIPIYIGKMLNKSGQLPFSVTQQYTDTKCMYGRGICDKVRYLKAYKAEMLQDMLDQSRMGGLSLITGNNGEVDGHYFNDPSEVNIIRYTSSIEQIQPLQFQPDLNKYQFILSTLDDLSIQDTGENIKATYQPLAEQLGTVEIIENNRMARVATIDENDDNGLCDILTEILSNISQFAPSLQKTTIKTKEGEVEREIYPTIKVPDAKVEQQGDGKIHIIHDEGEEGFFEFRPEMVTSKYYVKVITNSNVNVMNTLEKNSITQYINNISMIAQLRPDVIQEEDRSGLLSLMKQLYGYDDKFVAQTQRDKIKAENMQLMQQLQGMLGLLPSPQDPNDPMAQDPTQQAGGDPSPSQMIPQGTQGQQGGVPGSSQSQGGVQSAQGGVPNFGASARGALV